VGHKPARREALKNSGNVKTKSFARRTISLVFVTGIVVPVGAISYRVVVVSNGSERLVWHNHEIFKNLASGSSMLRSHKALRTQLDLTLVIENAESRCRGFAVSDGDCTRGDQ